MSYYRRLIKGYGESIKPLTQLLEKDQFTWGVDPTIVF